MQRTNSRVIILYKKPKGHKVVLSESYIRGKSILISVFSLGSLTFIGLTLADLKVRYCKLLLIRDYYSLANSDANFVWMFPFVYSILVVLE